MIVVDSSFLVSFYHTGDSNHAKAIVLAREIEGEEKLLSDVILFETLTILGSKAGMDCARKAMEEMTSDTNTRICYFSDEERSEILSEFVAQEKGRLSVADISVVYLAETRGSGVIAFDKTLVKEADKKRRERL